MLLYDSYALCFVLLPVILLAFFCGLYSARVALFIAGVLVILSSVSYQGVLKICSSRTLLRARFTSSRVYRTRASVVTSPLALDIGIAAESPYHHRHNHTSRRLGVFFIMARRATFQDRRAYGLLTLYRLSRSSIFRMRIKQPCAPTALFIR